MEAARLFWLRHDHKASWLALLCQRIYDSQNIYFQGMMRLLGFFNDANIRPHELFCFYDEIPEWVWMG